MKFPLRALALAGMLPLLALTGPVEAKGCIKGAIVGGAAGHLAGNHGTVGAAAGCAIGHHRATVKDREKAAAQGNAARDANSARDGATNRSPTQASTARSD